MNPPFAPTFQDFQKDTERHLERAGMTEKNEHGQTVYRGYYKALSQMFRLYIEKEPSLHWLRSFAVGIGNGTTATISWS
jgi:hypothetical protein